MIFDVKMGYFCCKARFVAGSHPSDTPHVKTYASIVSKESVRIALTLSDFIDLDVYNVISNFVGWF
jgi:hypothetical protein